MCVEQKGKCNRENLGRKKVFSFKIEQANWKVSTIMKKAQGYINLCRIGFREKMNGLRLFACIAAGFFKHSKYISWSQKERTNQRFLHKNQEQNSGELCYLMPNKC